MVFENGVKNIQAAAYNGARTVSCKGAAQHSHPGTHCFYRFLDGKKTSHL